jgi:hypothetical protein
LTSKSKIFNIKRGDKMKKIQLKAGSVRNQCAGCGELFNSVSAFDKHRTGSYGVPDESNPNSYLPSKRRCMNEEEMTKLDMEKNSAGFWITEPYERTPTSHSL